MTGIPEKRSEVRIGLRSEVTAPTATPSEQPLPQTLGGIPGFQLEGVQANFNFPRITDSFFFHLFVD